MGGIRRVLHEQDQLHAAGHVGTDERVRIAHAEKLEKRCGRQRRRRTVHDKDDGAVLFLTVEYDVIARVELRCRAIWKHAQLAVGAAHLRRI